MIALLPQCCHIAEQAAGFRIQRSVISCSGGVVELPYHAARSMDRKLGFKPSQLVASQVDWIKVVCSAVTQHNMAGAAEDMQPRLRLMLDHNELPSAGRSRFVIARQAGEKS